MGGDTRGRRNREQLALLDALSIESAVRVAHRPAHGRGSVARGQPFPLNLDSEIPLGDVIRGDGAGVRLLRSLGPQTESVAAYILD